MGNNNKSQKVRTQDGLLNHQRLGPIKIQEYKDPDLQQIVSTMQIKRSIESQRVLDKWKSQIMRIDDTQAKQILLLPLIHQFQKGGLCGSSGTLYIVYENMPYVLRGQIENRLKINRFFEEREIWYLLYNMIRAGNKFERIKKKVGNIHPSNILINDDGQIKLISTCSIPGEIDNFQLMTEDFLQSNAYLAPEQLANDSVSIAQYPPNVNPCLAEVFSIGMTILSASTLMPLDDMYLKTKNSIKFNPTLLQGRIKQIKDIYSPFFCDTVVDMLSLDTQGRKRASDIYQRLYQYENQILDLEPFAPPSKYQQNQRNFSQTMTITDKNNPNSSRNMSSSIGMGPNTGSNAFFQESSHHIIQQQQNSQGSIYNSPLAFQQKNQQNSRNSSYYQQQQGRLYATGSGTVTGSRSSSGFVKNHHNHQPKPPQMGKQSLTLTQQQYSKQQSGFYHPNQQQQYRQQSRSSINNSVNNNNNRNSIQTGGSSSSAIKSSSMQHQQQSSAHFANLNNVQVAQSNYIPNYQFGNGTAQ